MITDSKFNQWLAADGVERRVLYELDYSDGSQIQTAYLSDRGYIARPPGGTRTIYEPAVIKDAGVNSRIDNKISLSEIAVANGGYRAGWESRAWQGHEVRVLVGGAAWSIDDFRVLIRAENQGLSRVDAKQFVFKMADKSAVFDKELVVGSLPGGEPNPVSLGEPFNVPGAASIVNQHKFRVNDGAVVSAVTRVNGSSVSVTGDYANGQFSLASAPLGNVCSDVVEINNTVEKVFLWVAAKFGVAVNAANLAALPAYNIGLHYPGSVTGRQVLDDAANSIGASWRVNAVGELECYQFIEPKAIADYIITQDDIIRRGLSFVRNKMPAKGFTLNYKRNFSVSDRNGLAGILENNSTLADRLAREWDQEQIVNSVPGFPSAEDWVKDTYLVNQADAAAECTRRALLNSVQRSVWRIKCKLAPASIQVGDTLGVHYPRHGFESGKNVLVLGINKSLAKNSVELEVWH